MTWTWILTDQSGKTLAPPTQFALEMSFNSQSDAETWVGEVWRDLAAEGVEAVTLEQDGQKVYGPMSLRPANE